MPCYKKHKAFLIYFRLSTKEGLFTETSVKDQDIRFRKYNKDLYQECEWCYEVFEIEKAKNWKILKKTHLCVTSAINSYKKQKLRDSFSKNIYNLQWKSGI